MDTGTPAVQRGEFRGRVYDSIVDTIGGTPLVRLSRLAADAGVEIVCIVDLERAGMRCAGLSIVPDIDSARQSAAPALLDGIILTDTRAPQASLEHLCAIAEGEGLAPAGCVAVPRLLGISLERNKAEESAASGAAAG